jgi:hypothetical protein
MYSPSLAVKIAIEIVPILFSLNAYLQELVTSSFRIKPKGMAESTSRISPFNWVVSFTFGKP